MEARLTIFEQNHQKRVVQFSADSLTLGSSSADIELRSTSGIPLLLEFKKTDQGWWVMNPLRHPHIKVSGRPLHLEKLLKSNDEFEVEGHKIIFEIIEEKNSLKPSFVSHPGTDEALWNYLLNETEFDEILINGSQDIYVDWRGNLFKTPWTFTSDQFVQNKIVEHTQKSSGWASCRLQRTLRFHAVLPPHVENPHITIRKGRPKVFSLEELLETDFGTPEEIEFLKQAVKNQENIIISGGTSTGKTVLLRSLVEKIPHEERVLVLEEESETDWPHPHAVSIESGRGHLRSAVIESLRMRPNRIIVSEVRGTEVFEMFQAMNTGHAGSMTTVHANSSRDALLRLESLVLMSGVSISVNAVRRQLAQAIHIIVHLERNETGRRYIDHITRVSGLENDTILLSNPLETEAIGLKQKIEPPHPKTSRNR